MGGTNLQKLVHQQVELVFTETATVAEEKPLCARGEERMTRHFVVNANLHVGRHDESNGPSKTVDWIDRLDRIYRRIERIVRIE